MFQGRKEKYIHDSLKARRARIAEHERKVEEERRRLEEEAEKERQRLAEEAEAERLRLEEEAEAKRREEEEKALGNSLFGFAQPYNVPFLSVVTVTFYRYLKVGTG